MGLVRDERLAGQRSDGLDDVARTPGQLRRTSGEGCRVARRPLSDADDAPGVVGRGLGRDLQRASRDRTTFVGLVLGNRRGVWRVPAQVKELPGGADYGRAARDGGEYRYRVM